MTYWSAEVERQSAEIEMARETSDPDRIAAFLKRASHEAESQGALALSLRTAVTRARWSRRTGETTAALDGLIEVRARFDPTAGGMDLADADLLAATLRQRR